jgi:hypothetical protein
MFQTIHFKLQGLFKRWLQKSLGGNCAIVEEEVIGHAIQRICPQPYANLGLLNKSITSLIGQYEIYEKYVQS